MPVFITVVEVVSTVSFGGLAVLMTWTWRTMRAFLAKVVTLVLAWIDVRTIIFVIFLTARYTLFLILDITFGWEYQVSSRVGRTGTRLCNCRHGIVIIGVVVSFSLGMAVMLSMA